METKKQNKDGRPTLDDSRKSHRCNAINLVFMSDIADAYGASYPIMLNLNRSWIQKQRLSQNRNILRQPLLLF